MDNPAHWVTHLRVLSRIQDETGGFTEFDAAAVRAHSAPIYLAGVAGSPACMQDNLAVHAMARIMLHGRIDNIQTSWVRLGVEGTQAMLQAGANDLGGTLMEDHLADGRLEHGSGEERGGEPRKIGAGIGRQITAARLPTSRWTGRPP